MKQIEDDCSLRQMHKFYMYTQFFKCEYVLIDGSNDVGYRPFNSY